MELLCAFRSEVRHLPEATELYDFTRSILEERRENLHRRRKELEAQFMNTTNFSEQCSLAQQFGEVCEEEDAMLHGRTSRPQAEWMD